MCILCVIQKWSRRVATMLPWLVIPLIGLWALSQLLPPAFRFEITSPRLACVFVLLITLFWYEVLMPQLSAWRARRIARLRERKRFEAIELQKLRKTATRRCRNCLTPYRDQNPGGGRFMCSYCGHISKRPVLDLPLPPGMGISNTGIIKDMVSRSGKILNGKVWSDGGVCSQDWLDNGSWVGGSIASNSGNWRKNGNGLFGVDEHHSTEKSYSGIHSFTCKLLTSFFFSIRWLWRKLFRVSSLREECSSNAEHEGVLVKRGKSGANLHESRCEKARRKAEEKRQARLEKELLEEEEKKQREEVARLVEERRKLRDEKMEPEIDRKKLSLVTKERDSKKEAERRRQERRKEKDKGSNKSNSDGEELEKRTSKESEGKRDLDKKNEIDSREHQKFGSENAKGQNADNGNILKNNYSRGNTGTRYFDRMRGTFLSSSKAFGFGRGTYTTTATKENKFNSYADLVHTSANRRDSSPPEDVAAKPNLNGDDKTINRPVIPEPQTWAAPKRSWQQLFTRSSAVTQTSNANVIGRANSKFKAEVPNPQLPGQPSLIQPFDNPINFGLPSPFNVSTYPNVSTSSSVGFSPVIEPIFSQVGEAAQEFVPEEQELFEDPCYVPDPVSLLGPVSESLDNFQLDLGAGFVSDMELERPQSKTNISVCSEALPSPIESPMSREKHNNSIRFSNAPNAKETHSCHVDDPVANNKGTWQMWNTSPLPGNWLLPSDWIRSKKNDFVHPSQKNMASPFNKDDHIIPGTCSPQAVFTSNGQSAGPFSPVSGSGDHDPWLHSVFLPPFSGNGEHFSLNPPEDSIQAETMYGRPAGPANNRQYENSTANCWVKKECPVHISWEGVGTSSFGRPNAGGLYPTQDVQSRWSYN